MNIRIELKNIRERLEGMFSGAHIDRLLDGYSLVERSRLIKALYRNGDICNIADRGVPAYWVVRH